MQFSITSDSKNAFLIFLASEKSRYCSFLYVPGESIGLKFIPSQSELFRFIPIIVSEPMRIIPNGSEKSFVTCLMKNGQKSIRLNPINSETSIRMNPRQYETIFSIQINPNGRIDSDWFWMKIRFGWIRARIDSEWSGLKTWFRIGLDSFGLMSRN